jgi:AraC-like DNA-binding protein
MKKSKRTVEYRVYDLPQNFPILLLGGEEWRISHVRSNRLHFHNCLEVGICRSDSGVIEFEDKPLPFREGDVTVVSRNILHTTYSSPGQNSRWTYLFLQPERLIPPYLHQTLQDAGLLSEIEQNISHIFGRDDYPHIYQLAERIAGELEAKPANYQAGVRALCLLFMIELMRVFSDAPLDKREPAAESTKNVLVLAPALDYIHDNYHQQFRIETLARLCRLSPTHFRRIFGEIMRCAPLEFLHRKRITQARDLLLGTELTVLEISGQVGYLSLSSFNRHFLKETGVTPSKWRHTALMMPKQSVSTYSGWMLPERL